MAFTFSDADLERIASVLEVTPKRDGDLARFELADEESGRRITLEIRQRIVLPEGVSDDPESNLVSIYAASSFLQIQGCTGFIASQELGEVIFVARSGDAANALVVERQAGCSLYANVHPGLFSADFTQLPAELIMSSVALSMAEDLFGDLG
ncbi:MAG: hypothetical protein JJ896_05965 [Rhodothermales bacterium]|nr:hypothetical protein [Rhodothermales bacterium]MBO6779178.1 hypothetical protein [Rhodothermales bacterium]